jgi:hypothetical protein
VISLGDDEFIFSEQKIVVTYLRNTMKENFTTKTVRHDVAEILLKVALKHQKSK